MKLLWRVYYAGQIAFARAPRIDTIFGHILGGATGETFTIALYADAPGHVPGNEHFASTATFGADGWNGVSGLTGWNVAAGLYWVAFEIGFNDTLGTGSVTGALLDRGATSPLIRTAFDAGGAYQATSVPLSFGLQVDALVASVPRARFGGARVRRTRRVAGGGAQAPSLTGVAMRWDTSAMRVLLAAVVLLALQGVSLACSNEAVAPTGTDTHFPLIYGDRPTVAQLTALGRRMFFDPRLSASGKLACSTCHDPGHAFGPPDAQVVRPGGPALDRFGFRNTPSLTYLHSPIAFTEHFYEAEVTNGRDDQGPTGGRTWDGRVNNGHDQALMPLMDPTEMANPSREAIVERLGKASYVQAFRDAVSAPGEDVLDDPESTVTWITIALETFEQSQAEFHPFTTKYDAHLRDQVELSPAELRGQIAFNDLKKGNCASGHPSSHKAPANHFPIFTDFGFVALGVPRNRSLPANADPRFFDLGLCGPLRTDLKDHPEYCKLFRTPTLRNVALRKSYFHNGAIRSLPDAVSFYATRDTSPRKWYGASGQRQASGYDDLPPVYWKNVNTDIPFKPRADGKPRLSSTDIDDIVAFLRTLTDGYTPPSAKQATEVRFVVRTAGRRCASGPTTRPASPSPARASRSTARPTESPRSSSTGRPRARRPA